MSVMIPSDIWKEVRGFFAALAAPCKDCVRGNTVRCWHSDCSAFQFRDIAHRIAAVNAVSAQPVARPAHATPRHVSVENEILEIIRSRFGGGPVYPSQIALSTTRSRVDKSHAISRLIKRGLVVEERINEYTRRISLPKNGNPKGKK